MPAFVENGPVGKHDFGSTRKNTVRLKDAPKALPGISGRMNMCKGRDTTPPAAPTGLAVN